MKKLIFELSIMIPAIVAMLSSCATGPDTQQSAPKSAVQSTTGPTISGYIDVGAGKSFH
jgi:hypothetical protein